MLSGEAVRGWEEGEEHLFSPSLALHSLLPSSQDRTSIRPLSYSCIGLCPFLFLLVLPLHLQLLLLPLRLLLLLLLFLHPHLSLRLLRPLLLLLRPGLFHLLSDGGVCLQVSLSPAWI